MNAPDRATLLSGCPTLEQIVGNTPLTGIFS